MTMSIRAAQGDLAFHHGMVTWCALADICLAVAPEICSACKLWYTNDGDGLDGLGARNLADVLERRLADGTIDQLIRQKFASAKLLPDEICTNCGGSGIRTDAVGIKFGFDKRKIDDPNHPRFGQVGYCNGCRGAGSRRPPASHYPLENAKIVAELVQFLRASGGFRIW
jgi:hypothetical protein